MARGKVELLFAMTGEDKLSAVVQKNQKRLDNFMKTAQDNKGLSSLSVNIEAASTQFTELHSKVSLITEAASAAGAAFMGAFEFAKTGELANMVEHSFLQMAGSAQEYTRRMGELRESTAFLVDETSLQQFANRMAFMGVKFENTTKILKVATAAAKVSGEDLIGLARRVGEAAMAGELGALKQMGVMINLNKVQEDYARSVGKTREELSAFERGTVTLDAALEDIETRFTAMGISAEDLDSSVSQMQKTFDDFESNLQQKFAAAMATAKKEIDDFYDNEAHRRTMRSRIQQILQLSGVIDENREVIEKNARNVFRQAEAVEKLTDAFNLNERAQKHIAAQIGILDQGFGTHRENLEDLILRYARLNAEMDKGEKIAEAQEKQAEKMRVIEEDRLDILDEQAHIRQNELDIAIAIRDGRKEEAAQLQAEIKQANVRIAVIKGEISAKEAMRQANIITLAEETRERLDAENKRSKASSARMKREMEEAKAKQDRIRKERDAEKESTRIAILQIRKKMALDANATEHARALNESRIRVIQLESRIRLKEMTDETEIALSRQVLRAENRKRNLAALQAMHDREQKLRSENARATFEIESMGIQHVFAMKQEEMEVYLDGISSSANAFGSALAPANEMLAEQGKRMTDWQVGTVNAFSTVGEVAGIAAKNTDNLAKAVGPGLSAMKGITRGLIKDKQDEAAIHGAFEAAAAAASYATGNIPAGIAHTAASAMFFAIAKGKGKKQGGVGSTQGTFGSGGAQGAQTVQAGPSNVVLNVNGFVSADQNQLAKGMQDTLSGIATGGFVGGTI